jgi:hypothetical protein
MGIKDILGTISPAYGVIKGEGAFGKLAPSLGLIPRAIAEEREDKKRRQAEQQAGMPTVTPPAMKNGGKVKKMAAGGSASKRADGCATKGKTRGKMI